ncbi:uncharacterized protein IUM83_06551 [Phytophthora cinnamomi]|uniref:uncharacterized protein n=1 Tax=Phytophthora cinnamomi TaxID=4785 RepID=UPI00355A3AC4|nr:hypothetical protein IUM83_06551 [Phytophthora cinnamomi]
METTFSAVAADLDMMDWTAARKTRTRKDLDALKAAWSRYMVERNKRSDRLRARVVPYIWKWSSSQDLGFSEVKPEFMLEPTMPGYSLEYLPWETKTVDWMSEIAALDAAEPWRNGWIDVPEQHPYNTTFVPCNPSAPLFVLAGSSRTDIGRRVVPSSSLQPGELSSEWGPSLVMLVFLLRLSLRQMLRLFREDKLWMLLVTPMTRACLVSWLGQLLPPILIELKSGSSESSAASSIHLVFISSPASELPLS